MFAAQKHKRVYLDYASATPICKEVYKAMEPYFSVHFGNPSAVHREGVHARSAIEAARENLASVLHVRPSGVVFTGSGTESNNIALFGTIESLRRKNIAYTDMEIVSTEIEHASVSETLSRIQKLGVGVRYVPVDASGVIRVEDLKACITEKTALVTFAYANSEIGVVQQVGKLVRAVKQCNAHIYVHIDAAQAPLWLSCELDRLSVDMLSLDAGKCYGPKGVGVLAFRHGVTLAPHFFGGNQEGGLRPGTENTALIVGAVKALTRAQADREARSARVERLRDVFIAQLESIDGVVINGTKKERIANNINISIPGIDAEFAVISLDEAGIACSTKSACGGAKGAGSDVVRAITNDEARAHSTIRFSLGEETTQHDLQYTVEILKKHVEKMRSCTPVVSRRFTDIS